MVIISFSETRTIDIIIIKKQKLYMLLKLYTVNKTIYVIQNYIRLYSLY